MNPISRRNLLAASAAGGVLAAANAAAAQPRKDALQLPRKFVAESLLLSNDDAQGRRPRGDRPRVKAQRPGGLRDRQALAIMAVVDLGKRLVIDHDWLRSQARVLPSTPRM